MTHFGRIHFTTAHLPRRRFLVSPMQPIAHQSLETPISQKRPRPNLRLRLREETRLALAACHPLPDFDRLSPFCSPNQLADIYRNFTSADVSELLPFSSTTEAHVSSLWGTEGVVSSLTSCDQRKTSRVTLSKKCVHYPVFALVPQKNAELINALPVTCDGTSVDVPLKSKKSKWRVFRKFLCTGLSKKQAMALSRKNKTMHQSVASSSSIMSSCSKCSALNLQSVSYGGWITSGQENMRSGFPSECSTDASTDSSFQATNHRRRSESSHASQSLSFDSATPSHELKDEESTIHAAAAATVTAAA